MNHSAQLVDVEAIQRFVFAGNATFTIVSKSTGTRFTYSVRRAKGCSGYSSGRPWFVGVLTGGDRYNYVGIVPRSTMALRHTPKSLVGRDAPSAQGFRWLLGQLRRLPTNQGDLWRDERPIKLDQIEFWHAGKCGRCGRKLTVPSSIASGFGPVCIKL